MDLSSGAFGQLPQEIYTQIGDKCLLAVKPQRLLPKCSDSASKAAAQHINRVPHVFDIAASAYLHLREGQDQSILLLYFILM